MTTYVGRHRKRLFNRFKQNTSANNVTAYPVMMTYQEFVGFYEYMPKGLEHSKEDVAACFEQDQDAGMSWDRYVVKLDEKFTVVDVKLYDGEEEIKFTLPTDPEFARRAKKLITEDANFEERYPSFKE